jgi:hypothetical protein
MSKALLPTNTNLVCVGLRSELLDGHSHRIVLQQQLHTPRKLIYSRVIQGTVALQIEQIDVSFAWDEQLQALELSVMRCDVYAYLPARVCDGGVSAAVEEQREALQWGVLVFVVVRGDRIEVKEC